MVRNKAYVWQQQAAFICIVVHQVSRMIAVGFEPGLTVLIWGFPEVNKYISQLIEL